AQCVKLPGEPACIYCQADGEDCDFTIRPQQDDVKRTYFTRDQLKAVLTRLKGQPPSTFDTALDMLRTGARAKAVKSWVMAGDLGRADTGSTETATAESGRADAVETARADNLMS